MSRVTDVLISLFLAFSLSIAIKIPSLESRGCPSSNIHPQNPDSCYQFPSHDSSSQKLRRDDISDGISSIASDLSSIQAEATDFAGQVGQTASEIVASATAAVDGAAQSASQAVASASSLVSNFFSDTESGAQDAGKGVHGWIDSDTDGTSNKALLGVIIAVPGIVILAIFWFFW